MTIIPKVNLNEPLLKPSHPNFSSGPCAKFPGWDISLLKDATLGRSHRSALGLEKLSQVVVLTREILQIPKDYEIAILPGSTTGALESALWNLLGASPLTVLSQDVFSNRWEKDVTGHLKLKNLDVRHGGHGDLPSVETIPPENDVLLNWNGSTSGARYPNADFLDANRPGLVIADITSAAYTAAIPWNKFDASAFSWQKGLGSEAAHGMLVLSPKAIARINAYQPPWPLPYIFKLRSHRGFYKPLFEEKTLNTISLLCVEDYLQALKWAKDQGGLPVLLQRSQANFEAVSTWVSSTPWVGFLTSIPENRSISTPILKIIEPKIMALSDSGHRAFLRKMTVLLAEKGIAYDILNHGGAPPSLRLWGGPTIDVQDTKALLPWIDWAYQRTLTTI